MRKTAFRYAILGDGRLAQHMRRYLRLSGLPCSGWSRHKNSPFNSHTHPDSATRLRLTVRPATHVLLLVSDAAIAGLVSRHPVLQGRQLVHCSGALSLPGVAGAHPLMTFASTPYTLEQYRQIPFLVESGHRFEDLLPGLPNLHHEIEPASKALYHALCVTAGNFPQILWKAVTDRFGQQLDLHPTILEPYLRQALDNFLADPGHALTGPLARADEITVARNLAALKGDALHGLYRAFVEFHAAETNSTGAAGKERAL